MIRLLATQALVQVIQSGRSLTQVHLDMESDLAPADAAKVKHLTFEACRYFHRYQAVLDRLLHQPLKPKDSDLLCLIHLAMHEIASEDKADHAAINESVELARELGKGWASKMVNAVLRSWQRQKGDDSADWANDIRFQTAHPGWLAKRIRKMYPEQANAIFEANNARAPMTLRTNFLQVSREQYLSELKASGLDASLTPFSEAGLTLKLPCPVARLPGFDQGRCSVQDEAAQMAATLLDADKDHSVLDACCAPGGKTGHILERGVKHLFAVDADSERLKRVEQNLKRLNLNATVLQANLANDTDWADGMLFDRILLDAPCSAIGVIRRHPDIKIHRQASDIEPLVELQRQILSQLWSRLKPGGILVYATCSILKTENREQIDAFISQHNNAELVAINDQNDWQLFPQLDGHDGFYYAKLRKHL